MELGQRCAPNIYCIWGRLRVGIVGVTQPTSISPLLSPSKPGRYRQKTEGRLGAWSHFLSTHSVLFAFPPRPRSHHPAWHDGEEKNPDLTHSGPKESAGEFPGWESSWGEGVLGSGPSLGKGLSVWGNCKGTGSLDAVSRVRDVAFAHFHDGLLIYSP